MAILVESIVLCVLFTIPIMMMSKDPVAHIHNYPPAIIERAIELGLTDETHRLRSLKTTMKKLIGAIVIACLCALIVYHVNGARSFVEGIWLYISSMDNCQLV